MSPLRSSAGPATCRIETSSSRRMICASEVLPSPGGPASSTWSSASPRPRAASSAIPSCSLTRSWPTNSASDRRAKRALELLLAAVATTVARSRSFMPPSSTPRAPAPPRAATRRRRPARGRRRSATIRARRARREPAARPPAEPARAGSPSLSLSSITTRCAVFRPMPGNRLEPREVVARDRAPQLGRRRARDDRERHLRPDPGDAEQQLEQLALVARTRIRRAGARPRGRAGASRPSPPRRRARSPAASRRRGSRRRRRRARGRPACARRPCRAAARSCAPGTASHGTAHRTLGLPGDPQERRRERVADRDGERVGRVVGARQLVEPEDRLHHPLHLPLVGAAVAAHRLLDRGSARTRRNRRLPTTRRRAPRRALARRRARCGRRRRRTTPPGRRHPGRAG